MAKRSDETKEEYNARMNSYMKEKYFNRRSSLIEHLGGVCVDCGSKESLEFDHLRDKKFNIAARLNSAPWNVLLEEAEKCVLRCGVCHSFWTATRKLQQVDLLHNIINFMPR